MGNTYGAYQNELKRHRPTLENLHCLMKCLADNINDRGTRNQFAAGCRNLANRLDQMLNNEKITIPGDDRTLLNETKGDCQTLALQIENFDDKADRAAKENMRQRLNEAQRNMRDLIHTIHRRIEGVMDKVRNIFHDLVVSFANLFGGALTFASVAAIGWQ